jgi:hypothetical protein
MIQLAIMTAFAGAIFLFTGTFAAVISYNNLNTVPYSFANHFVSELGWTKASRTAWLFNWSLVVGAIAFLPMMIALGLHIRTRLGYVAVGFGLCAMLAASCIGVLPMGSLRPHLWAALIFFLAWFLTTLLFTLAFCPYWNPKPSRSMVIAGMLCGLFCLAFFVFPKDSLAMAIRHVGSGKWQRPHIWWLAVMEWCVVLSSCLWASTAAWLLWRNRHSQIKQHESEG